MTARRLTSGFSSFIPTFHLKSAPRLALAAGCAVALAAPLLRPPPGFGQADVPAGESENAKHQLECVVIAPALVRSGPGENFYPTQKLPKGVHVIAVNRTKDNWLKIIPPEGSFCYVPKAYVQLYGDGKQGKVTSLSVVKAGSVEQTDRWAVLTKLDVGAAVTVLSEDNEYLKIKPPESAYLYISQDLVDPIRAMPGPHESGAVAVGPGNGGEAAGAGPETPGRLPSGDIGPIGPTTRDVVAQGPATRPVESESLAKLQQLETQFGDASKKPLNEQPVGELLAAYEQLARQPGASETARRTAEIRIATLKIRGEARETFADVQKEQEQHRQWVLSQAAERGEIQARIQETAVQIYTAVGTLRTSSLQVGSGPAGARTTLYRLTDPATGRTVVYVRTADPKYAELIGQFIGVKGEIGTEAQLNLKVVSPTAAELVDPAKVNDRVAAGIVPPSLLGKAPQASTVQPGQ